MNQISIELLSSEELENVTGGNRIVDGLKCVGNGVLTAFTLPMLCFDDSHNPIEAVAGLATCALVDILAIYGAYKAISGLFCSKNENEKENEKEQANATLTA